MGGTLAQPKGAQWEMLYALALRRNPNKKFICFPSYSQLAEDTQLDPATLKRAAKALEDKHLIKRVASSISTFLCSRSRSPRSRLRSWPPSRNRRRRSAIPKSSTGPTRRSMSTTMRVLPHRSLEAWRPAAVQEPIAATSSLQAAVLRGEIEAGSVTDSFPVWSWEQPDRGINLDIVLDDFYNPMFEYAKNYLLNLDYAGIPERHRKHRTHTLNPITSPDWPVPVKVQADLIAKIPTLDDINGWLLCAPPVLRSTPSPAPESATRPSSISSPFTFTNVIRLLSLRIISQNIPLSMSCLSSLRGRPFEAGEGQRLEPLVNCHRTVAVGTIITDRPPHRSVRALVSAYGSYLG